jgi:RNA polymerase sigma-70 factor (ECF subfamily)
VTELVARATAGDLVALEQLFLLHYDEIASQVVANLPKSAQGLIGVEDVLQETFAHAIRDIQRFELSSEHGFAQWLRAIADHRLRDLIRGLNRKKRGGQYQRLRVAPRGQDSSILELVDALSADDETPSRVASRNETVQAVHIALDLLPEKYRKAIDLRYLQGKTVAETAAAMRCSPSAARGILERARKKMRADMQQSSLYS